MEKERKSTEALKAIKNIKDNKSWFRETPHYWAEASLPLAYVVACVKWFVKVRKRLAYSTIELSQHGVMPGQKAMGEEIASIIPESGKEKIRKAVLHPETELLPAPKPTTHWTSYLIISILIHVFDAGYQFT